MPSKKLLGAFIFFDVCLLAAGVTCLLVSFMWRKPDLLLNMVVTNTELTGGLALGVLFCLTFLLAIGGILQRGGNMMGLVALNWMLILDSLAVMFIGSWIWFFTLQERNNFHVVFDHLGPQKRILVQDALQCCGYFNSSDLAETGGTFCASSDFIQNANNATGNFCVDPITAFADYTLNNMFSTIYGFMAIVICLFLASLCVIKRREEEERFKRIDAKRGGRGFV